MAEGDKNSDGTDPNCNALVVLHKMKDFCILDTDILEALLSGTLKVTYFQVSLKLASCDASFNLNYSPMRTS